MPGSYPVGGDAHYDVPLSNFAVEAFAADAVGLVGQDFAPEISVDHQSDKYYKIEKDAFLRVPETRRAPRDTAAKVYFTTSSDSFFCDNYALSTDHALEDLVNADAAIRLRQNGVRLIVGGLRRDEEVRIANLVTSISNIGSGVLLTGANKWGDPASSPISDVNTGHAFIERQTGGLQANTGIIDSDTLRVLRTHPEMLDMYKYTAGGQITNSQLLEAFDLQRLLVARGKRENMPVGSALSSISNIWGNGLVLALIGPANGLQSQTFMARFRWRNPIYPAAMGVQTKIYGDAGEPKVEVVEAGYYQDEKIIAPDLGYAILNTL